MIRKNVQLHPELASISLPSLTLVPTRHAKERAGQKRVPLPSRLSVQKGSVVEMETSFGAVSKLVVRLPLTEEQDLVLVLVPRGGEEWVVVTCWTNERTDKHRTLNRARLATA